MTARNLSKDEKSDLHSIEETTINILKITSQHKIPNYIIKDIVVLLYVFISYNINSFYPQKIYFAIKIFALK